jgi:hypothetical protein
MLEFDWRGSLLADLVEGYLFEGLDEQLLRRIPYALFVSFWTYLLLKFVVNSSLNAIAVFVTIGLSFLIFAGSTRSFNRAISDILAKEIFDQDYKKFVGKIQGIYEGRDSALGDIDGVKNWGTLLTAIASGVSLMVFLTAVILVGLDYLGVDFEALGLGIVLTALYIFYEVSKASFADTKEAEDKQPFAFDAMESYTVTNSLRRVPFGSRSLVFLISRFFAPLASIDVPKFSFETPLVYQTPELMSAISTMAECGDSAEVCLKHEDGLPLNQFLVESPGAKVERITVMLEKSPKELFPYLLNPDYSYTNDDSRRWSVFRIFDKKTERTLGRVFMHKFRAVIIKRRLRRASGTGKIDEDFQDRYAIQFVLVGDRGYVQYFKSRIEVLSTKVPPDLMNAEYDPKPGR